MKLPKNRWVRRPLIAVLLLVGFFCLYHAALLGKIYFQFYALRSAGCATSIDEWQRQFPHKPGEPNGAKVLMTALGNTARWKPKEVLDAFGTVSQHSYFDYTTYFDADYLAPTDFVLRNIRSAGNLAMSTIIDGTAPAFPERAFPEHATRAIVNQLAVARSLESIPGMPTLDTRTYLTDLASSALEKVLSADCLSRDQLVRLREAFKTMDDPDYLKTCLSGDLCWKLAVMRLPHRIQANMVAPDFNDFASYASILLAGYKAAGLFELDYIYVLTTYRELIQCASLPYPERGEALAKLSTMPSGDGIVAHYGHVLADDVAAEAMPDFTETLFLREACLTIAVALYRHDHGNLPESLDALVPNYLNHLPETVLHQTKYVLRRSGQSYAVTIALTGPSPGPVTPQFKTLFLRRRTSAPTFEGFAPGDIGEVAFEVSLGQEKTARVRSGVRQGLDPPQVPQNQ